MLFGNLIWYSLDYLPYVIVSVFNTSLGILLLDIPEFVNCLQYSGRYSVIFVLLLKVALVVEIPTMIFITFTAYLFCYSQSAGTAGYELQTNTSPFLILAKQFLVYEKSAQPSPDQLSMDSDLDSLYKDIDYDSM